LHELFPEVGSKKKPALALQDSLGAVPTMYVPAAAVKIG
jgi:hypothetical protein